MLDGFWVEVQGSDEERGKPGKHGMGAVWYLYLSHRQLLIPTSAQGSRRPDRRNHLPPQVKNGSSKASTTAYEHPEVDPQWGDPWGKSKPLKQITSPHARVVYVNGTTGYHDSGGSLLIPVSNWAAGRKRCNDAPQGRIWVVRQLRSPLAVAVIRSEFCGPKPGALVVLLCFGRIGQRSAQYDTGC
ncbi:uncharacterized protein CLUP02_01280 [Colletotrichum lupini]|uniref:Uncharacterized protein n=1 Tax=Colletotrichum lupini TaxID=145971 RepID=A0A9Q8SC26_9PEZI|nr:uncharacterized protein CLUP02_01280 [Colletotrichum lupini]UQC74629.1 hypothetical protein CLUP02_01280 [Colletotrichum lupini]